MHINKKQSGFTLIELVMVIVILGILAAVALPKFVSLGADARIGVMKSVEGSMRSANAMIYAKAAAASLSGATGIITNNGVAINVAYGYAATATDLAAAMDLIPATDFTLAATTITHAGAVTPAGCLITYVPAAATTAPTYTLTSTGC
ncbi:type II secretion system protein [Actimicrobium sp. CCI2.3]|uniref:type II secretion system protein n=1 Tax=Actimicrobium sp. CCI2.3 TaxID=3048616 RepID=UPI002AB3FD5F|nr:type II secretion system protein [Actimicrobium sp. CCI2.3]MDY7572932.1 type II secretion system protein [Actimicrobium sp. CCI2.3]MEB0020777.1 type II secretion system protein [Actimicrobium sp. CCI2.3]